jgi:tetratricopeptide (TPR) repeat protein
MILRNEEETLPRCLRSAQACVDEIVVVDTGSTDGTREVAASFGARVFEEPWEGDFSKPRNRCLERATGDWVLHLDADEELAEGSAETIRNAIRDSRADAFLMNVFSFFNRGASRSRESKIRLFRRNPRIRYRNVIHEQPFGYLRLEALAAGIHHYGYDLEPEKLQEKFERNSALLRRQITQNPDHYWHRHNLAVAYASVFRYQDAVREGSLAIRLAEKQQIRSPNLLWTHYIVSACCLQLGDLEQAECYAGKALQASPYHLDSHFILVLTSHRKRDWPRMERHAIEYLRLLEELRVDPTRHEGEILNMAGEGWRVQLALGDHRLEKGERGKAEVHFQKAERETPAYSECHRIIADCYRSRAMWDEAARHYALAAGESPPSREALMGLALARVKLGKRQEALPLYDEVLRHDPDSLEALVQKGNILYEEGLLEDCVRPYRKAWEREPRLIQAALRLSRIAWMNGEIDALLPYCESLLKTLGIPSDREIRSIADLAGLFLLIAHGLDGARKEDLFLECMETALRIDPEILRNFQTPEVAE